MTEPAPSDPAQRMIDGVGALGVGSWVLITFGADRQPGAMFSWGDDDLEQTRVDRIANRIMDREVLVQTCRICGCTETDACYEEGFGTCGWADASLCTQCARQMEEDLRTG